MVVLECCRLTRPVNSSTSCARPRIVMRTDADVHISCLFLYITSYSLCCLFVVRFPSRLPVLPSHFCTFPFHHSLSDSAVFSHSSCSSHLTLRLSVRIPSIHASIHPSTCPYMHVSTYVHAHVSTQYRGLPLYLATSITLIHSVTPNQPAILKQSTGKYVEYSHVGEVCLPKKNQYGNNEETVFHWKRYDQ